MNEKEANLICCFGKRSTPAVPTAAGGGVWKTGRSSVPKKGIVSEGDSCRSFVYDPLKRQPPAVVVPDFFKIGRIRF